MGNIRTQVKEFFLKTKNFSRRFSDLYAKLLCVSSFFILTYMIIRKYLNLCYDDWDLAFFTQAMWNLSHGSQYSSLVGINFWGDHAYLIAFLILPIFKVFPHPLTLEILKILFFSIAGFLFYKIAKDNLGWKTALVLNFLYLSFPPNVYAILYDFNPESLSPVLIFGLFYCWKRQNFFLFLLVSFILMLLKENMALVVAMFGVYILFAQKQNKILWGGFALILGISVFIFFSFVLIPYFRETPVHAFVVRYRHLGTTLPEIFYTIIFHPRKIFQMIFDPRNMYFITELFGPFLIPSFLSPHILFLMGPILLQHLLSEAGPEHTIYFHYSLTMVPFIFLASVNTLRYLHINFSKKRLKFYFFSLFIILSFIHTMMQVPLFISKIQSNGDRLIAHYWAILKEIPPPTSVITTFRFQPELSLRKSLYSFHTIFSDFFQDQNKMPETPLYRFQRFELPPEVDYALVDFKDRWILNDMWHNPKTFFPLIQHFIMDSHWRVRKAAGDVVLFDNNLDGVQLLEKSRQPPRHDEFSRERSAGLGVDGHFVLMNYIPGDLQESSPGYNERLVPFIFLWHSIKPTHEHYAVIFRIQQGKKIFFQYRHMIGYGVYPTGIWREGEFLKEYFVLGLPPLEPGEYSVEVIFFNLNKNQISQLYVHDQAALIGSFKMGQINIH